MMRLNAALKRSSKVLITAASYKGGCAKTTTAIHLAAYLQTLAPTLLVDGDAIRASTKWSKRSEGKGLPFMVRPVAHMARHVRITRTSSSIPRPILPRMISGKPRRAAICLAS